ncbi:MAG: helix-turn-helix domain-containing protein [Planctomycetota bacterium]
MPRRDLTEERTEQILAAYERCVARFGLEGTSLERVAEEAEVKRSLLRHYVGNRDDLVLAMAERFGQRYRDQLQAMTQHIREGQTRDLLDILFAKTSSGDVHDVLIMEALIVASGQFDEIRALVSLLVEETINAVRDQLRLTFPRADAKNVWTIAYGVVAIYFNLESLAPLRLPRRHRSSARSAAGALIETLAPR